MALTQFVTEHPGNRVSPVRVEMSKGRARLAIRVQPRAARSEVVGAYGDALKVRLAAPPVDGAANDELIELLARTFAVTRRAITILAGEHSRSKIVEIEGVTDVAVRAILDGVAR